MPISSQEETTLPFNLNPMSSSYLFSNDRQISSRIHHAGRLSFLGAIDDCYCHVCLVRFQLPRRYMLLQARIRLQWIFGDGNRPDRAWTGEASSRDGLFNSGDERCLSWRPLVGC